LWQRQRYSPPALWSGLNLIQSVPEPYRSGTSVKGLEADDGIPAPLEMIRDCDECTPLLLDMMRRWNLTRSQSALEAPPMTCACHRRYSEASARRRPTPIMQHVEAELRQIEGELFP